MLTSMHGSASITASVPAEVERAQEARCRRASVLLGSELAPPTLAQSMAQAHRELLAKSLPFIQRIAALLPGDPEGDREVARAIAALPRTETKRLLRQK